MKNRSGSRTESSTVECRADTGATLSSGCCTQSARSAAGKGYNFNVTGERFLMSGVRPAYLARAHAPCISARWLCSRFRQLRRSRRGSLSPVSLPDDFESRTIRGNQLVSASQEAKSAAAASAFTQPQTSNVNRAYTSQQRAYQSEESTSLRHAFSPIPGHFTLTGNAPRQQDNPRHSAIPSSRPSNPRG